MLWLPIRHPENWSDCAAALGYTCHSATFTPFQKVGDDVKDVLSALKIWASADMFCNN